MGVYIKGLEGQAIIVLGINVSLKIQTNHNKCPSCAQLEQERDRKTLEILRYGPCYLRAYLTFRKSKVINMEQTTEKWMWFGPDHVYTYTFKYFILYPWCGSE